VIPAVLFAVACACSIGAAFAYQREAWGRTLLYLLVGGVAAYFAIATLGTVFPK
jgi:hypothetical protein